MIVHVDDNRLNTDLLSQLIHKHLMLSSKSFHDPFSALEWIMHHEVELIFTDYSMPALNGFEFIEHIKSVPEKKDIPIVMLTANRDQKIRIRALELGVQDFLHKPIDRIEFIARTRNMLALNQQKKELKNRNAWLSEEIKKATAALREQEREVIVRLSHAAEYRSPETGLHVMRVALYSKALARELGMSEEEQELMFAAATMHDIGKVSIPDKILFKDDKLDMYEFAMMKLHTLTGYEIMQNSSSALMQMAADIALYHHEHYDGSGYPRGLKGEAIPLAARICAISDVFDALTSERPYKHAWSPEEAIHEIERNAGLHFDGRLVLKFKKILSEIISIRMQNTEVRHEHSSSQHTPKASSPALMTD